MSAHKLTQKGHTHTLTSKCIQFPGTQTPHRRPHYHAEEDLGGLFNQSETHSGVTKECVCVCVCVSGTRKRVLKVRVLSEDIQELNDPAMKTAILKQVSYTSL